VTYDPIRTYGHYSTPDLERLIGALERRFGAGFVEGLRTELERRGAADTESGPMLAAREQELAYA
jgi:hypothetical protein